MPLKKFKMSDSHAAHLIPGIGITSRMVDHFFNGYFKQQAIDLTKEQWILLKVLSKNNGQSQNKIACLTQRDKTSMTRLIATLERKNMIARKAASEDKRVNRIFLTTKGEQILNQTLSIRNDILAILEKGITQDEIRQMLATLEKIQQNIDFNSCSDN